MTAKRPAAPLGARPPEPGRADAAESAGEQGGEMGGQVRRRRNDGTHGCDKRVGGGGRRTWVDSDTGGNHILAVIIGTAAATAAGFAALVVSVDRVLAPEPGHRNHSAGQLPPRSASSPGDRASNTRSRPIRLDSSRRPMVIKGTGR